MKRKPIIINHPESGERMTGEYLLCPKCEADLFSVFFSKDGADGLLRCSSCGTLVIAREIDSPSGQQDGTTVPFADEGERES